MRSLLKFIRNLWTRADVAHDRASAGTGEVAGPATEAAALAAQNSLPVEATLSPAPAPTATVEAAIVPAPEAIATPAPAARISRRTLALRLAGAARANRVKSGVRKTRKAPASLAPRPVAAKGTIAKRTPDLYPMKRRPPKARKPALKVLVARPKVRPSAMIIPMPIVARSQTNKPPVRLKKAA